MVNYEDWLDSLRAEKTRRAYAYWLGKFSKFCGRRPDGMLRWTPEEAEDRLVAFQNSLVKHKMSGATIHLAWNVVRKWLGDNRIPVRVKCGVRSSRTCFDYIPSPQELKVLLDESNLLYKTAFGLIAFSGMRPVDVRNLTFESVKRSLATDEEVLTITTRQQKTDELYTTFLGPQGASYLRALLERRRAEGESIRDKTILVSWDGTMIPESTLRNYFDRVVKRTVTRFPSGEHFRRLRVYSLRKYFRMGVNNILGESEAEYMMGHSSGIRGLSATYSGLRENDSRAIAMLRDRYIKALPKLETELTSASITGQVDVLSAKVALLEETILKKKVLPETRDELREFYLKTIGTSGGKAIRHDWQPEVIAQDIEAGANRDPLDDLSDAELDQLFIRALRKKMMGPSGVD